MVLFYHFVIYFVCVIYKMCKIASNVMLPESGLIPPCLTSTTNVVAEAIKKLGEGTCTDCTIVVESKKMLDSKTVIQSGMFSP